MHVSHIFVKENNEIKRSGSQRPLTSCRTPSGSSSSARCSPECSSYSASTSQYYTYHKNSISLLSLYILDWTGRRRHLDLVPGFPGLSLQPGFRSAFFDVLVLDGTFERGSYTITRLLTNLLSKLFLSPETSNSVDFFSLSV
jgi:hypothetical protein